ncbi:MAG: ribose-phosphate diphosphokinase [Candidatus Heimdallarchaeaceae archaeon]
MKILPGPSSVALAKNLASLLNIPLVELQYKHFYDGETYLRVENDVEGEEILIVQSTYPPQEKHLLELLLLASTLKELGATQVVAIIPYLCYSRADKRKLSGEVLSHQITLELLYKSGIDTVITTNVHNPDVFLNTCEELEKVNLNLFSYIGQDLLDEFDNHILIGPDKGAEEDVKMLAETLSTEYYLMEKQRDAVTHEITMKAPDFDIKDKDVLLIDDIITSGGTAKRASKIILDKQPSSLTFLCIHAMSKEQVYLEMEKLGVSQVISTDTIPSERIKQISIAPYLAKFVEEKYL